jgi:sulfatase modifying factor 1
VTRRSLPSGPSSAIALALALLGNSPYKTPPGPELPKQKEADSQAGAVALSPPIDGMALLPGGTFEMGSGTVRRVSHPRLENDKPVFINGELDVVVEFVLQDELEFARDLCRKEVLGQYCHEAQLYPESVELPPPSDQKESFTRFTTRKVTVSTFLLDRTEVTVSSYRRCVELGGCSLPTFPSGDVRFDRPSLPVTHVTWEDARKFCEWRKARLPTEAEWERAARGLKGRRFPWGNGPDPKLANHGALDFGSIIGRLLDGSFRIQGVADDLDGYLGLAPVGSFPSGATPEGVFDLAGNVGEWVADLYEVGYPAAPATDPKGPTTATSLMGQVRVVRGGSYRQPLHLIRGASRSWMPPSTRDPDLGFRCAKDAS